ncbi:hypothetical protein F4777DRAFT_574117 [Nemania sp. FL0916]|nr:hypothetical protein F4777DRAFT_574117 [Nemania sp. FL0916]
MPPLHDRKRCHQCASRRSRVSRITTQQTLLVRRSINNEDDNDTDSDENVSPDAEKPGVQFTVGSSRNSARDDGNSDDDNNDDNGGGDGSNSPGGRGRGFSRSGGFNSPGSRDGRGSGSSDTSFRPPSGNGDSSSVFRNENGGGGKSNSSGDGKQHDNSHNKGSDSSDGGGGGGGGSGGSGGDKSGGGTGKDGSGFGSGPGSGFGSSSGSGNKNGNGNGNGNGNPKGNGNGGGGTGGGSGNSGDGSDSSPDPSSSDSSSTSLAPPATTTTTSTAETSTTVPVVVSTSVSPTIATTSSIPQTSAIPIPTPEPVSADPSPIITDLPNLSTATDLTSIPSSSQTSLSFPATNVVGSSTPQPTQTSSAINVGDPSGPQVNGNSSDNSQKSQDGGTSPTSERVLIAVGAIGGIIVLCFIAWAVYRTAKNSNRPGRKKGNDWISQVLPWRRTPPASDVAASNGSREPNDPLPTYEAANNNPMEAVAYYDQEKVYLQTSIDTANLFPATLQAQRAIWQASESQTSPPPNLSYQYQQSNNPMLVYAPEAYYNQYLTDRQPSNPYNPAQRPVHRASEISSLSSGFGDGELIVIPLNKPPAAQVATTETGNRPYSWQSRIGAEQRRDTTTTTTSDRPARFRSMNSWVDQQMKIRMQRANSRAKAGGEIPVNPAMSNQPNVMRNPGPG